MGRIGSLYEFVEATLIIITTGIIALLAQIFSIQFAVITGALVMLFLSVILCTFNLRASKRKYYQPNT